MQLFYSRQITGDEILLDEEESRHALSVLRKKEGDPIQVMDGMGNLFHCILRGRTKKEAILQINERESKPKRNLNLSIAIAPTKNIDRTEWFVEKSIELGVESIRFIRCEHSERQHINMARMEKITLSASKQSLAFHFPTLHEIQPLDTLLTEAKEYSHRLVASCEREAPLLDKNWQGQPSVCVLIGPEGDFSAREYALAKETGWQTFSLGEKRLRTETAALAVCDRINFIFGE